MHRRAGFACPEWCGHIWSENSCKTRVWCMKNTRRYAIFLSPLGPDRMPVCKYDVGRKKEDLIQKSDDDGIIRTCVAVWAACMFHYKSAQRVWQPCGKVAVKCVGRSFAPSLILVHTTTNGSSTAAAAHTRPACFPENRNTDPQVLSVTPASNGSNALCSSPSNLTRSPPQS